MTKSASHFLVIFVIVFTSNKKIIGLLDLKNIHAVIASLFSAIIFLSTWLKLSVSLAPYHLSNIYWLELDLLGIRGLEQSCKTWFFLWHAYVPSSRYECMWFCINKNQLWQPRAWKMTWQHTMIFFIPTIMSLDKSGL